MIVNRSGSKIFGAHLSKAERTALDIEVRKAIAENQTVYHQDMDAAILYFLHTKYGFGEKRLRDFWNGFNELHGQILREYMVQENEAAWVCREALKKIGVDVKAWYEEDERKEKERERDIV